MIRLLKIDWMVCGHLSSSLISGLRLAVSPSLLILSCITCPSKVFQNYTEHKFSVRWLFTRRPQRHKSPASLFILIKLSLTNHMNPTTAPLTVRYRAASQRKMVTSVLHDSNTTMSFIYDFPLFLNYRTGFQTGRIITGPLFSPLPSSREPTAKQMYWITPVIENNETPFYEANRGIQQKQKESWFICDEWFNCVVKKATARTRLCDGCACFLACCLIETSIRWTKEKNISDWVVVFF